MKNGNDKLGERVETDNNTIIKATKLLLLKRSKDTDIEICIEWYLSSKHDKNEQDGAYRYTTEPAMASNICSNREQRWLEGKGFIFLRQKAGENTV